MTAIAKHYYGTGSDKTSVARVFMSKGNGKITINNRPLEEYFGRAYFKMIVMQSLQAVKLEDVFNIKITVKGGGNGGQADAIRLGISNALLDFDEDLKSILRHGGFLTRDRRKVERKKYGLRKARKSEQYSKR